ncbi:MAG TPA: hypothetical protein VKF84_12950 [Candidatus Sulfotelmatobacter sp.]|nr:hypothetical protein [Candidatus Sulfotelmatobacter sp.]
MTDLTPFSSASGVPPEPAQPPSDSGTALLGPPLEAEARAAQGPLQVWMHRISVFLFVLISAVAGVLLIILPWTPEWTDNYLLMSFPALRTVVSNGFFRGLCSGLGLLDIWIGFWEALHYHEQQ